MLLNTRLLLPTNYLFVLFVPAISQVLQKTAINANVDDDCSSTLALIVYSVALGWRSPRGSRNSKLKGRGFFKGKVEGRWEGGNQASAIRTGDKIIKHKNCQVDCWWAFVVLVVVDVVIVVVTILAMMNLDDDFWV